MDSTSGFRVFLAESKRKELEAKYGKNPKAWKNLAAASIIGQDIAEGFAKYSEAKLEQNALNSRIEEVKARSSISLSNLYQEGEKVAGMQETAFAKAGVKLEGSALNVLTQTAQDVYEAAKVKQHESDYEAAQMESAAAAAGVRAKNAGLQTLFNIGADATMVYM